MTCVVTFHISSTIHILWNQFLKHDKLYIIIQPCSWVWWAWVFGLFNQGYSIGLCCHVVGLNVGNHCECEDQMLHVVKAHHNPFAC